MYHSPTFCLPSQAEDPTQRETVRASQSYVVDDIVGHGTCIGVTNRQYFDPWVRSHVPLVCARGPTQEMPPDFPLRTLSSTPPTPTPPPPTLIIPPLRSAARFADMLRKQGALARTGYETMDLGAIDNVLPLRAEDIEAEAHAVAVSIYDDGELGTTALLLSCHPTPRPPLAGGAEAPGAEASVRGRPANTKVQRHPTPCTSSSPPSLRVPTPSSGPPSAARAFFPASHHCVGDTGGGRA